MPKADQIKQKWFVVDAADQTLGRFASRVASILKGKNKAYYAPHMDCGDFVVVVNADKVRLTGKKTKIKEYIHNTMYPGGQRITKFEDMIRTKPERVVYLAVHGMLPKNTLGAKMIKKLKIYAGEKHPHSAQNPETLKF
ncbi:50S ribosomal protein L13 [bacterium]|nr:50S ribosomal protein L13 [bacterium]NUN46126.1 50S ribosomal protein L13 [bacterium]HMV26720.1 50S ribosomal protein L13 [bacterium]HMW32250.1 50S ribosomal protein L13 [bacterium]HMW35388.1 50S ribosomal protein L13 [bacterium]